MSKRKLFILFFSLVILLSIFSPAKAISAQGAKLSMEGIGEAPADTNYNLNLGLNSPTNIAYLSIILAYDSTILEFDSVDSQYLSYDAERSTEGFLSLRADQVNIPQGDTDLGSIEFKPRRTGNFRFRIQNASAFTADELIVGVNATQTIALSLVESDNYIPLPIITPIVSPTSEPVSATSSQESITEITETIEVTTSLEEVEPTTSEEASDSIEESSSTEEMETVLESSEENESSTIITETSTIFTESSKSTIESEVTSTSDDSENDESGFRIELPIIFLLLLAGGITTVIISRKK